MKFPFEFGVKLIFRLVLPGFLLSLGFFPPLIVVLRMNGWAANGEYAFIILVILLGWAISLSDMRVYMLFEGRRYWPPRVRRWSERREQKRLARIQHDTNNDDDRISTEAFVDLRDFPMTDDGEYEVKAPSRLGNLLRAVEDYSDRRYGASSIFYWYRIWLKLDKDTREEIDNSQALADSTLYASFALLLSGGLWLLYALTKYLVVLVLASATTLPARLQYDLTLIDQFLPRKGTAFLIAVVFLFIGFLIYRLSLTLHAQFGELFKSVFDLYVVDVSNVTKELATLSELSPAASLSKVLRRRDQYDVAWRYLQYYLYRCPACNDLLKPGEIKTHVCHRKGWPFEAEPAMELAAPMDASIEVELLESFQTPPPPQTETTPASDVQRSQDVHPADVGAPVVIDLPGEEGDTGAETEGR